MAITVSKPLAIATQLRQLCQAEDVSILAAFSQTCPAEVIQAFPWAKSMLLFGWGNRGYGQRFQQSPEYQDGQPNPIDRWSLRIGETWAAKFEGSALWPFTGPPYWPFLAWAQAAGASQSSRLGMHLHKDYGLWHSYRFALVLPVSVTYLDIQQSTGNTAHTTPSQSLEPLPLEPLPCVTCPAPCVTACPADAFAQVGNYDVTRCRQTLTNLIPSSDQKAHQTSCLDSGCLARHACPIAPGLYTQEQERYHLDLFVAAAQADT